MVLDITIPNMETANKLNKEASKANEELWVHADSGLIMVNARSIMGLYALVGVPCKLVAGDCSDPTILTEVAKKAGVL